MTKSMGRVGCALDTAAAESFNSTLEWELLSREHFLTKDQARREVTAFIDRYNHRRRHSSAEMMAPVAYETGPRRPGSRRSESSVKPSAQPAGDRFDPNPWHPSAHT